MTKSDVQTFAIPPAHTWLSPGSLPFPVTHLPHLCGSYQESRSGGGGEGRRGWGGGGGCWRIWPPLWLPCLPGVMTTIVFPTVDARGQKKPIYWGSELSA